MSQMFLLKFCRRNEIRQRCSKLNEKCFEFISRSLKFDCNFGNLANLRRDCFIVETYETYERVFSHEKIISSAHLMKRVTEMANKKIPLIPKKVFTLA